MRAAEGGEAGNGDHDGWVAKVWDGVVGVPDEALDVAGLAAGEREACGGEEEVDEGLGVVVVAEGVGEETVEVAHELVRGGGGVGAKVGEADLVLEGVGADGGDEFEDLSDRKLHMEQIPIYTHTHPVSHP